jgi:hypothetical protein
MAEIEKLATDVQDPLNCDPDHAYVYTYTQMHTYPETSTSLFRSKRKLMIYFAADIAYQGEYEPPKIVKNVDGKEIKKQRYMETNDTVKMVRYFETFSNADLKEAITEMMKNFRKDKDNDVSGDIECDRLSISYGGENIYSIRLQKID